MILTVLRIDNPSSSEEEEGKNAPPRAQRTRQPSWHNKFDLWEDRLLDVSSDADPSPLTVTQMRVRVAVATGVPIPRHVYYGIEEWELAWNGDDKYRFRKEPVFCTGKQESGGGTDQGADGKRLVTDALDELHLKPDVIGVALLPPRADVYARDDDDEEEEEAKATEAESTAGKEALTTTTTEAGEKVAKSVVDEVAAAGNDENAAASTNNVITTTPDYVQRLAEKRRKVAEMRASRISRMSSSSDAEMMSPGRKEEKKEEEDNNNGGAANGMHGKEGKKENGGTATAARQVSAVTGAVAVPPASPLAAGMEASAPEPSLSAPSPTIRLWLRQIESEDDGVPPGRFERYASAFERHFATLDHLALVRQEEGSEGGGNAAVWKELYEACEIEALGDRLRIKRAIRALPEKKRL